MKLFSDAVTLVAGDFASSREVARLALARFGCDEEVLRNEDGSPHWPEKFVGSLSHSNGRVVAAVAKASERRGLGVDVERIREGRRLLALSRKTLSESERYYLAEPESVLIAFSAKESLFKCLNPIVNQFFWFEAAEVEALADGKFTLRLTRDLSDEFPKGWVCEGTYLVEDGFVYTAIEILNTETSRPQASPLTQPIPSSTNPPS